MAEKQVENEKFVLNAFVYGNYMRDMDDEAADELAERVVEGSEFYITSDDATDENYIVGVWFPETLKDRLVISSTDGTSAVVHDSRVPFAFGHIKNAIIKVPEGCGKMWWYKTADELKDKK